MKEEIGKKSILLLRKEFGKNKSTLIDVGVVVAVFKLVLSAGTLYILPSESLR